MMVPAPLSPISPGALSAMMGPVSVVHAPPTVVLPMADPPEAGVIAAAANACSGNVSMIALSTKLVAVRRE